MLVIQLIWRRDTVGLHERTRQGSQSALISPLSNRTFSDGLMPSTGSRPVVPIPIRHGFNSALASAALSAISLPTF